MPWSSRINRKQPLPGSLSYPLGGSTESGEVNCSMPASGVLQLACLQACAKLKVKVRCLSPSGHHDSIWLRQSSQLCLTC